MGPPWAIICLATALTLWLLSFCPHFDDPSLELLGLDAVLAATTFTGADAALSGPHVFRSLLEHHCR